MTDQIHICQKRLRFNKRRNRDGFTLAELLIVVAIIAVLVAVAIPIFTSQLEKVRSATCAANRRSLKAEISADYQTDDSLPPGNISLDKYHISNSFCPKHGKISAVFKDNAVEVYCSIHASAVSFGNPDTLNQIFDNIKYPSSAPINSGDKTSEKTKEFLAALDKAGINLEELGAVSWRAEKSGGYYVFYWTPVDISTVPPGTKVPIMRYYTEFNVYALWNATIGTATASDNSTYNQLGTGSLGWGMTELPESKAVTDMKDKANYDKMNSIFQSVLDKYNDAKQ